MTILFVSGINDLSTIGLTLDDDGKFINLLDGNCSIHHRIPLQDGVAESLVLFGKGVRQTGVNFPRKPSLIFNQISDADTHRGALARCVQLCEQIGAPVINHPEAILGTTRDRVFHMLQGIPGVVMPRTERFRPGSPEAVLRAAESRGFSMPYIVRIAGDHGGKSMIRIGCREDVHSLHAYPFDGRDFYLTEYVDCRDRAGFYNRQRLVVIDGEPLLRGSLYDENWKVHGGSRAFMLGRETWEDDRARSHRLEADVIPRFRSAIQDITSRLKLDIYGIDCNLDFNGRMLVYEANANMNILTNDHPEMNDRMDRIKQRILAMLGNHSGETIA